MKIKAIPTEYKGIVYRSRLEAQWASFFDLLGWTVIYEPVDFNGWIPDFALIGAKETVYVEVKPFYNAEEWTSTIHKIIHSGCDKEVLLLGVYPTR